MPDETTYGIKITETGSDAAARGFDKVTASASRTHKELNSGVGFVERWGAAMARSSGTAQVLLRSLGPIGGDATEMAARLERAGIAVEALGERVRESASSQRILQDAYAKGAIASATYEAAQARLASAQEARAATLERIRALEQSVGIATQAQAEAQRALSSLDYTKQAVQVVAAQRAEKEAQGALISSSAALRGEKNKLAEQNREVAESQKLLDSANKASSSSLGLTVGVIGGVVVALAALATGIYAVFKAWEQFTESLAEGAKIERARLQLAQLLGNTQAAAASFKELSELASQSGGLFNAEQLSKVAGTLYNLGTGYKNLIPLTHAFAEASAATGQPIETIAASYSRLIEIVNTGSPLAANSLRQFTTEGINLTKMLADSTGKNENEIRGLLKAGLIGADDIRNAFLKAAEGSGVFSNALERQAGTALGLIGQIKSRWKDVQAAFGEPIVTALEPILEKIIPFEVTAEGKARALGSAVADIVTQLGQIAGTDPWGAFKLASQLAFAEVGNAFYVAITKVMDLLQDYWKKKTDELVNSTLSLNPERRLYQFITGAPNTALDPFAPPGSGRQLGGYQQQQQQQPAAALPFNTSAILQQIDLRRQLGDLRTSVASAFDDATTQQVVRGVFATAFQSAFKDSEGDLGSTLGDAFDIARQRSSFTTAVDRVSVAPKQLTTTAPIGGPGTDEADAAAFVGENNIEAYSATTQKVGELTNTVRQADVVIKMFYGDMKVLTDLQSTLAGTIARANTPLEGQRTAFEAVNNAIKAMQDPLAHINDLIKLLPNNANSFDSAIVRLNAHLRDFELTNQTVTTSQGLMRTAQDGIVAAINQSNEPLAHLKEFLDALPAGYDKNAEAVIRWAAAYRELQLREASVELSIKANTASFGTSIAFGLQKASDQWGSFDEQVAKSATDVATSLSGDISTGLTDILTGTKSVSEGFRDMALSVIKDIESIIVKMLIQLAIQRLLGAFGIGGTGGLNAVGEAQFAQGVVPVATLAYNGGLMAFAGGGFTGRRGKFQPVGVVHGGEYVFTKEQTSALGVPFLQQLADVGRQGYARGGYVGDMPRGRLGGGSATTNNVSIAVNFNGNNTATGAGRSERAAGASNSARDLEKLVVPVIEKWAVKNKHFGGMLHQ